MSKEELGSLAEKTNWQVAVRRTYERTSQVLGYFGIDVIENFETNYVSSKFKGVFSGLAPDRIGMDIPGRWKEELEKACQKALRAGSEKMNDSRRNKGGNRF